MKSSSTRTRSFSAPAPPPMSFFATPKSGRKRFAKAPIATPATCWPRLENRLAGALGAVRKGRDMLAKATSADDQPLADAAAKSKRAAFDLRAAADETAELESVST